MVLLKQTGNFFVDLKLYFHICITMKQQNQYWWWHTNTLRGL